MINIEAFTNIPVQTLYLGQGKLQCTLATYKCTFLLSRFAFDNRVSMLGQYALKPTIFNSRYSRLCNS